MEELSIHQNDFQEKLSEFQKPTKKINSQAASANLMKMFKIFVEEVISLSTSLSPKRRRTVLENAESTLLEEATPQKKKKEAFLFENKENDSTAVKIPKPTLAEICQECAKKEEENKALLEDKQQAFETAGVLKRSYDELYNTNSKLMSIINSLRGSFRVMCRLAPYSAKTCKTQNENCLMNVSIDSMKSTGSHIDYEFLKTEQKTYQFDKVLPRNASQEDVYQEIGAKIIGEVLKGGKPSVMTYGPTNSGKTFTMQGNLQDESEYGLIPRISNHLLQELDLIGELSFIEIGVLEVYNEKISDLFCPSPVNPFKRPNGPSLLETSFKNQTFQKIETKEKLMKLLKVVFNKRKSDATVMNQGASSRSHCIFTIRVPGKGTVTFVDMAGSEKALNFGEKQIQETKAINKSLFTFASVMRALRFRAIDPNVTVPFRNSKLTTLLKESLESNSTCTFLVTLRLEHCQSQAAIRESLALVSALQ